MWPQWLPTLCRRNGFPLSVAPMAPHSFFGSNAAEDEDDLVQDQEEDDCVTNEDDPMTFSRPFGVDVGILLNMTTNIVHYTFGRDSKNMRLTIICFTTL